MSNTMKSTDNATIIQRLTDALDAARKGKLRSFVLITCADGSPVMGVNMRLHPNDGDTAMALFYEVASEAADIVITAHGGPEAAEAATRAALNGACAEVTTTPTAPTPARSCGCPTCAAARREAN